jgi:hypothetical protein
VTVNPRTGIATSRHPIAEGRIAVKLGNALKHIGAGLWFPILCIEMPLNFLEADLIHQAVPELTDVTIQVTGQPTVPSRAGFVLIQKKTSSLTFFGVIGLSGLC